MRIHLTGRLSVLASLLLLGWNATVGNAATHPSKSSKIMETQ